MDDIALFMHHHHLADTLQTAATALAAVGLLLNHTKTECWIDENVVPPTRLSTATSPEPNYHQSFAPPSKTLPSDTTPKPRQHNTPRTTPPHSQHVSQTDGQPLRNSTACTTRDYPPT